MSKASVLRTLNEAAFPIPSFITVRTPFTAAATSVISDFVLSTKPTSRFAVRSSADCEDSTQFSYAGLFKTFLNVQADDVLKAASDCCNDWALASQYATAVGDVGVSMDMEIIVQKMIIPKVSGVLFTCNPITGEREFIIEAAFGLGALLVEGRCQPDRIRVDHTGRIKDWKAGFQEVLLAPAPESRGLANRRVPILRQSARKLKESALCQLVRYADRIRSILGYEVDMEWCVTRKSIFVLQARPITTGRSPERCLSSEDTLTVLSP